MILSVLGLLNGFRSYLDVFINNKDFNIVYRNFAILSITL